MGNCVGRPRPSTSHTTAPGTSSQDSAGRNQPLKRGKLRWKSDVPWTEGQLRSKRDEFWDTAPAFEGRKEIWDALKAAASAIENEDYDLAQAITDGANITCPQGSLTDCYDELGNRYQLPLYVLSAPINLVEEASQDDGLETEVIDDSPKGVEIPLKFRISTSCKDVKLTVRSSEAVGVVKRRLSKADSSVPEASLQRWFFGGKLLSDKLKFEDIGVQRGFVIQVIVQPAPSNDSQPVKK